MTDDAARASVHKASVMGHEIFLKLFNAGFSDHSGVAALACALGLYAEAFADGPADLDDLADAMRRGANNTFRRVREARLRGDFDV